MKPVELLRKIDKFGVHRITGTIDAGGVPIHVEIITRFKSKQRAFAVGFAFDSESFGKLSEKLSGIGVDFLDALGLELQVRFAPGHLIHNNGLLSPQQRSNLQHDSLLIGYVFSIRSLPIPLILFRSYLKRP